MMIGTGLSIHLDYGQQKGTVWIVSAADYHHVWEGLNNVHGKSILGVSSN